MTRPWDAVGTVIKIRLTVEEERITRDSHRANRRTPVTQIRRGRRRELLTTAYLILDEGTRNAKAIVSPALDDLMRTR